MAVGGNRRVYPNETQSVLVDFIAKYSYPQVIALIGKSYISLDEYGQRSSSMSMNAAIGVPAEDRAGAALAPQPQGAPASIVSDSVPTVGLVRFKSAALLSAEEQAKKAAEALLRQPSPRSALAALIMRRFDDAQQERREVEEEILDNLRRRHGVYAPARLAEIKRQGGSEIFFLNTQVKCLDAEALLSEVILPGNGERSWLFVPTSKPDLPRAAVAEIVAETVAMFPPDPRVTNLQDVSAYARSLRESLLQKVDREAKRRAIGMTDAVADLLEESDWDLQCELLVSDLADAGTAILRGPFVEERTELRWLDEDYTPDLVDVKSVRTRRVSPLNFFPAKGATCCEDAAYMFERDAMTRRALLAMDGLPGWDADRIRQLIRANPDGTAIELQTDGEMADLESREDADPESIYQVLWYTGLLPGDELTRWGLKGVDEAGEYECVALLLHKEVVHVRINSDPLGRRWYSSTVFKRKGDRFWGLGPPRLMQDVQDAANAAGRHLLNNLAIGSGPQVEIPDVDALAEGEDIRALFPWRIWQGNGGQRQGQPLLRFNQPTIYSDQLRSVYDYFSKLASDRTGIPDFVHGAASPAGPASNATALSILLNQSSRVLRRTFASWDRRLMRPLLEKLYTRLMLTSPDQSIKGDLRPVCRGSLAVLIKEQQALRLAEVMRETAGGEDLAIIGRAGRAKILRARLRGLDLPADIVPTDKELEQREQAQETPKALLAGAAGGGAPLPPG